MKLIKGECLTEMHKMHDESIDLIICDLPYGVLNGFAKEWDNIINPNLLFQEYNRLIKNTGVILLFGVEPFSTLLRTTATDTYKYDLYWIKPKGTGFLNAKHMPLRDVEIISVFSKGIMRPEHLSDNNRMTYNPQGLIKLDKPKKINGLNTAKNTYAKTYTKDIVSEYENYPKSTLYYDMIDERLHPTQKPTELYEYLIRTYSNPGDVILDNCAGSGTLGAAGLNIPDREYIMIELEPKYQDIIIERLPDIEVIEGSQEIYKPILTVDRIIELAKESKGGIEFNKMLMDEDLDASKLLKEHKVKSIPQLRLKLRKL